MAIHYITVCSRVNCGTDHTVTISESSLARTRLQVETLFSFDAAGRMVGTNEEPPFAAPRVFLGRTPEGNTWRLRYDVPPEQAAQLARLLESEPPLARPGDEPRCLPEVVAVLARSAPVTSINRGPAFQFETAPPVPAGTLRLPPDANVPFHPEMQEMGWQVPPDAAQQPCHVVIEDGAIVSLCHSSRLSERAAEAGVSTAPSFRGRGLAKAVTAAWAAEVMATGRAAFYSTTWENAASRAIAASFGLVAFGEDMSVT